jgi:uncharacterized membrane protein (DUF2068 family)
MKLRKKRPAGLIAIVAYKTFVATLLGMTAVSLLFALENHQGLERFSESYLLESKLTLIDWILDKVLNFSPKTLQYGGLAATLYAGLTTVEAVGLWYEKAWAEVLVIVLVGLSIPFEVWELLQGSSFLKLIVFVGNVVILGYLVRRLRR